MRIAAYARYSSDSQREASLEDQLRNCRTYAARQGWPAPVEFTDAAVSGSRLDRPGYVRLLSQAGSFDVILVDDLSRLSRDSIESARAVKRLTFAGVRLIGVSDGVDTGRKSHKADVGLRGLMSELYLDDLAEKTHRGLTGRALQGASAGGLPYGYRVAGTGRREVDPEQAAVVRRVFTEFAAGRSPRAIAAGLNADGVPSARGSTWAATALRGDVRRGIGMLVNPIYVGQQVWNRSHWVKHPDTGRRVRQERPESEWITTHHPELAIVDSALWEAVQARIHGRRHSPGARRAGRPPRHLLSGILRCGSCGGPMTMADAHSYACSRSRERGTCIAPVRVARDLVEGKVLEGIREQLLTEAAFERVKRQTAAALRAAAPDDTSSRRRLAEAERVHRNVAEAIRQGIITPTTRTELLAAEAEVAAAAAALEEIRAFRPATVLPGLRATWERAVATLGERARRSPAAREAIHELVGDQITVATNENGDLVAEIAASLNTTQIRMVAGAGFEPATFGL